MPGSDDDAQRIAQLTPGTFVRHTRHPEWGVGVVSYKPVEADQVPVIWPDQPNITAYQYPVWLERVTLGTVAAAPAGTGPNDDGWKVIAKVQDTTVFALFPEQVAWPVTGQHDDGTPCHHTVDNCKEHGSCIDCDMCKTMCECN